MMMTILFSPVAHTPVAVALADSSKSPSTPGLLLTIVVAIVLIFGVFRLTNRAFERLSIILNTAVEALARLVAVAMAGIIALTAVAVIVLHAVLRI